MGADANPLHNGVGAARNVSPSATQSDIVHATHRAAISRDKTDTKVSWPLAHKAAYPARTVTLVDTRSAQAEVVRGRIC